MMLASAVASKCRPAAVVRAASRRCLFNRNETLTTVRSLSSASTVVDDSDAPASFDPKKMETDKRYQGENPVPESLLHKDGNDAKGEYSIRGSFREGRAVYLDTSATTPLDPRVLDQMLPYMVSTCTCSTGV